MSNLNVLMTCPRGLEEVLCTEINAITGKKAQADKGMVRLSQANWRDVYALNLHLRTASRVLVEIAHQPFLKEDDIYRTAKNIDWQQHFTPDHSIKIRIESRHATVKSINFIALRCKDGICDFFREATGRRPNVDKTNPDIIISVFINDKESFIYLDTSGEALFKRGYRQETGIAPLRENLAAGLLMLSGFDGTQNFFDPMCGSGTIAIEAALMASKKATGLGRSFAFEKFNHFQAAMWNDLRQQAESQIITPTIKIVASDVSSAMMKSALINAQKAKVDDIVRFQKGDFATMQAPAENGILVTNPPYGERLGELDEIRTQYPKWGSTLKKQFTSWTAGMISADREFPSLLRLQAKRKIPVYNGKLDCRLYLFDIVEGSHRKS